MSRRIASILCVLCVFASLLWAADIVKSNLQPEWICGQGTHGGDHVIEGLQTRDGGYIAVGITAKTERALGDLLVVKTDAKGKLQWKRVIGQPKTQEEGRCILEVADGYILGGVLSAKRTSQPGLLKLDRAGKTVWTKSYPGKRYGAIRGIDLTPDGGIIATGFTDNESREVGFIAEEAKGLLLKTDATGKLLWTRELPVSQGAKVHTIGRTGFAICTTIWVESKGKEHQDACLLKTDTTGKVLWRTTYGRTGYDQCFDFDPTPDGGFILAGHTTSHSAGWDVWLVRVDKKGKMLWEKTFGEPIGGDPKWVYDECYCVKVLPDGGFALACGSGIEPTGKRLKPDPRNLWGAWVLRTDPAGKLLWHYFYHVPKQGHNAAEWLTPCRDGGLLLFLDSDTEGTPREGNVGMIKLRAQPPRP